jgi:hypothetical protein
MKTILSLILAVFIISCSSEKTFKINGKDTVVEPYGLFNPEAKNDSVLYKVSVPDVIVSIIFSETVIVPVVSVGWYIYQPIGKK